MAKKIYNDILFCYYGAMAHIPVGEIFYYVLFENNILVQFYPICNKCAENINEITRSLEKLDPAYRIINVDEMKLLKVIHG